MNLEKVRLDEKGCSFGVAGDLLMGYTDTVKSLYCLRCFSKGKLQIDVQSEAQGQDAFFGRERRSILKKSTRLMNVVPQTLH